MVLHPRVVLKLFFNNIQKFKAKNNDFDLHYDQICKLDDCLKRLKENKFTHFSIKIQLRNYVEKKNNIFYPTDLGKKVNKILKDIFNFVEINYSAKLEKQLDLI